MAANDTWIITGGAGYIGAHVADEFLSAGFNVVIYDSLVTGLLSRVEFLRNRHKREIPLVVQDICSDKSFNDAIDTYRPDGILHLAALKSVSQSVEMPDKYFEVNYFATKKILEIASSKGIRKFIFSSSAAVYGSPNHFDLVKEDHETIPISPYGKSKLDAEKEVNRFILQNGNSGTSLRYFNVVGTAFSKLKDNSTENLVPIIAKKLSEHLPPVIFGTDYPTPDGTCIRDYVDVRDVARAHLEVAKSTVSLPLALNVGTGLGKSVRDVIKLVAREAKVSIPSFSELGRRPGDPAYLCADVSLIKKVLGFSAEHSLKSSIRSLYSAN